MGALDACEALTSLGRHLARMPMDPRVGKALVYGCLLGCLDPVLTVTAALAHGRPVFLNLQVGAGGHCRFQPKLNQTKPKYAEHRQRGGK